MKWTLLGISAALIATPLAAAPVSVAWGDWKDIPEIQKKGELRISGQTVDRIAASLKKEECPVAGGAKHVRLSVPFLMEFAPTGEVQQIVIWKLNCPQIEALVGGTLDQLAREGEYKPTGLNQTGWYRGEFKLLANN
jgi:hypothetical protein